MGVLQTKRDRSVNMKLTYYSLASLAGSATALNKALTIGAGADCTNEIAKTIDQVYHRCLVTFGSPEGDTLDRCVSFNVARIELEDLNPQCDNINTLNDFYHKAFLVAADRNRSFQREAMAAKVDAAAAKDDLEIAQQELVREKASRSTRVSDAIQNAKNMKYQIDELKKDLIEADQDLSNCKSLFEEKHENLTQCHNDLQNEQDQVQRLSTRLSVAEENLNEMTDILGLSAQGWIDGSANSASDVLFYRQTYDTYPINDCDRECKRLHKAAKLGSILNDYERQYAEGAMTYAGSWVAAEVRSGQSPSDRRNWYWPDFDRDVNTSDSWWYGETGSEVYYVAAWYKQRGLLNHWNPQDSYSRCLCEIRV